MNLEDVILRDTRANQPAATDVAAGTLYYVTDESVTERSTGATWESYTDGGTYTDEKAQDAVGAMADANSLAYTDATPLLAVKRQMSITADGSGLKLDGDSATPGNNKVYGTDGAGAKGWQAGGGGYTDEQAQDAVGGILDTDTFTYDDATPEILIKTGGSITKAGTGLLLDGDAATPGNNKYYGTNGSGTKGFFSIAVPVAELNLSNANVLSLNSAVQTLIAAPGALKLIVPQKLIIYKDSTAGAWSASVSLRIRAAGVGSDTWFNAISFIIDTNPRTTLHVQLPTNISELTTVSNFLNKAIEISSSADVTGGNAANFIKIRLLYYIADFN